VTEPLFVGVDLGTARVKVGVFDRHGTQQALRIVRHARGAGPDHGAITQDASAWWRAVCRALRAVSATVEVARIAAIAVCGQGPSLVSTDARLQPRGPALTWLDKRAGAEAQELAGAIGRPVDAGHYIAKALRQSRVEPDPGRRWYFQAWDYLASRLCGTPHTSSLWLEDELAASGLPREHFPPYYSAGSVVGPLDAAAARVTGLPMGIPVVAGTNDGIAACIGSGLTKKGQATILGGTSGGFVLCWDPVPGAWTPPAGAYPEPPGLRYLGATIASSGLMLDWLAGIFGARDLDLWLPEAGAIPAGAGGLVVLPYIAGAYLPYAADGHGPVDDPAARAIIFGLSTQHSRAHLIRAALEGVAFAIRQVYDATISQAAPPLETLTVGGQAHSALWNQIKADVLAIPVLVPGVVEAGSLGAACLAVAGSGHAASIWEAAARMVQVVGRLEPDPNHTQLYDRLYRGVYSPLYPQVRDLYSQLSWP
jgi:xylulokinase